MRNFNENMEEITWSMPELIIESWEVTESLVGFINLST